MLSPYLLTIISRYQLASVAVGALATLVFWPDATFGVLAGGGVMAANFVVMKRAIERLMDGEASRRAKVMYGFFLVTKFFVVMGTLALLVLVVRVHPLGIAIGMLSLFAGIGLGLAHHAWRGAPAA